MKKNAVAQLIIISPSYNLYSIYIMPNLTSRLYSLTNSTKTDHYIETGTYLGNGIKQVLNTYEHIHSIELLEKWYEYNVKQFENNKNVHMYLGDSKKILPEVLNSINAPVTIYLDAHYSGKLTAFGDEETPLLYELEILKKRDYDDIIIIDDCRLLGKKGECGAGPDHPIYPTMAYDWSEITESKIISVMKQDYILLKNDNSIYTDGPGDQYILIKQNRIDK